MGRVKPPRVRITYGVELGDGIQMKELPFVVGILADLSGKPTTPLPPLKDRSFVLIDRDNINEVMSKIKPRLTLNWLDDEGKLIKDDPIKASADIEFESVDDFYPTNVVKKLDDLNTLFEERIQLRDLLAKLDGNNKLNELLNDVIKDPAKQTAMKGSFDGKTAGLKEDEWEDLAVDEDTQEILSTGGMHLDESQMPHSKKLLAAFTAGVIGNGIIVVKDTQDSVNCATYICNRIATIDDAIEGRLNEVMHHPDFQALEGSWRGLHYLVMNSETNAHLKLKLLNVSKQELLDDLTEAIEFHQSALFKMVYEEEYGTFGGEPYSLLMGDYEIGCKRNDTLFLAEMSKLASAAHVPFIANAYAEYFDLARFSDLQNTRDLSTIFEKQELIKWHKFRKSEDSRYATLALPRVLMRLPYNPEQNAVDQLNFTESIRGTDVQDLLWSGAAWVLAQRITNAFSLYGWTAAISGVEGGGLVENLPTYSFQTARGNVALNSPTEVSITDGCEKELNDLGFMAICHCHGTDKVAFLGGQSTNQSSKHNTEEANADAQISSPLPYVLAATRFAHYIKVIMRDKIGSFMTRKNVEDYLNTWISEYVLLDDSSTEEIKARYPLRQAHIAVSDLPGSPGSYRATVFLKPHFQLEQLTTSIRLVAELPS